MQPPGPGLAAAVDLFPAPPMSFQESLKLLKYRRTKVVATLGPASESTETIGTMIAAGVNVFRVNMSHGDHDGHALAIERVREIAARDDALVAILADLCGPKIRVGKFADGGIDLRVGDEVVVTCRDVEGRDGVIPSQYRCLADDVAAGQRILLADGNFELRVLEVDDLDVRCEVVVGGRLTNHKGINLPDAVVTAPSITEKDRDDARFAIDAGVDFLALSFVRNASDVRDLIDLVEDHGGTRPAIIAKIERPEAVDGIDAILEVADGIMVARGDLGVELPAEHVPVAQQHLLERARKSRKPAIVATQMLESMITAARPTRAEVTDVAHSVTGGADAVMLSGETAVGADPVAAVRVMDKVTRQTEGYLWVEGQFDSLAPRHQQTPPLEFGAALARATARLSRDLMVRAIFVVSREGISSAEVAAARPAAPVVALTGSRERARAMNLLWGVIPIVVDESTLEEPVEVIREVGIAMQLGEPGHCVLAVRGFHTEPEHNRPSVTLVTL